MHLESVQFKFLKCLVGTSLVLKMGDGDDDDGDDDGNDDDDDDDKRRSGNSRVSANQMLLSVSDF